ncbi:type II secretion system F family protein [Oryzihumus sp.]
MSSQVFLYVGLLAAGLSIAVLVMAFTFGAGAPTGVARSLSLIEHGVSRAEVGKHELPATERLVRPLLDGSRGLAVRLSPAGTHDRLQHLLDLAGNPGTWTVERLLGLKGAGMIGGAVVVLLLAHLSLGGLVLAVVAAAVGFFLPDLLVYNVALKRQNILRRGLADALDMLTVCVEAGQGFDAALLQVARSTQGPVAGEFARVLQEIQIGKSRGEAFSAMAARTKVTEVRTFVTALVQADRLGLPIAAVLREQSVQMRLVRRQRAEEKAQKIPVKILFPMLLCIFPALFIVIIGPGVIRIVQTFGQMGH